MPPRTLATLAHALSVAPDLDAALLALGDALSEVDRFAKIALVRFDARRSMLVDRLMPAGDTVTNDRLDTTFDHLPTRERIAVAAGGTFVDFGEQSDEFAALFAFQRFSDVGWLSLRGLRFDGQLSAIIVLYETRKFFGARSSERLAPSVALFELAFARFFEREARSEAVRTLEDVTHRVHSEYERRLGEFEEKLVKASGAHKAVDPERLVSLEREAAKALEDARRAARRADAVEVQVTAAVDQLEKAHIELHRRSEALRQKTRTLYLIDRVLTLDATTDDPREMVHGLLTLVGDDMGAQRCSLMLLAPEENMLYLAAARGIAPNVPPGYRVRMGEGVAGKVAATREPLLVQDVDEARSHPLLRDEHFTTGSFISFPLVYHGSLVGVVNLTNRAMHGIFVEEDIERVRLLALVIGLVATQARLPERMLETLSVG
ncbi:MAG: GAF domain-containing protein [Gemmatimonadaceae bacterium]|nr:GAF domain-containing protein [Gemmatimonadaceae bacterium]NUO95023.1 GAF domain-containing protein [Gemmatimonadaceae bacterium]NUP72799.1 GAF domain-containing protein [Gemmatimonadaceae bacterium]NUR33553.1 GAF domain-containing protein [Gemmatimonadaceae bacterium]NUS46344.1 GAF domain-containing protein [Gemmatimonadaceae bacterium]